MAGGINGEVFFFHGSRAVRRIEPQGSQVAALVPMKEAWAVVNANGICSWLNENGKKERDFSSLAAWPSAKFRTPLLSGPDREPSVKKWRVKWRVELCAGASKEQHLLLSSRTHLLYLETRH